MYLHTYACMHTHPHNCRACTYTYLNVHARTCAYDCVCVCVLRLCLCVRVWCERVHTIALIPLGLPPCLSFPVCPSVWNPHSLPPSFSLFRFSLHFLPTLFSLSSSLPPSLSCLQKGRPGGKCHTAPFGGRSFAED